MTRCEPSLGDYTKLSRDYTVIPVWKDVVSGDADPLKTFRKLGEEGNKFILESVEKGGLTGRYSFIGLEPEEEISSGNGEVQVRAAGSVNRIKTPGEPLACLEEHFAGLKSPDIPGMPPFVGGAVGYVGYDYVRNIERLPSAARDDIRMPEYYFMIARKIIMFDHHRGRVKVIYNSTPGPDRKKSYGQALREIERIEKLLSRPEPGDSVSHGHPPTVIESNFKKEAFCDSVKKAKDYIRRGEIFQVVLSQRLKTSLAAHPFVIYRTLRKINPSPYMFFLKMGEDYLVGSSPETHVKVIGDRVTIRPIAGTRRRGKTASEDAALEKSLLSDEKERAEHLMLVDLARNDLGKVAAAGSVKVDEFMKVYKYSHVMHIESNVVGSMAEDGTRFDVFSSSFPAGTVSGAPKIRAMEIIDELEPTARGPYAGAVGYFSFSGNMDTCITIRTILVKGGSVYVQSGAGIVADSVPAREYRETLNKAEAMIKSLSDSASEDHDIPDR